MNTDGKGQKIKKNELLRVSQVWRRHQRQKDEYVSHCIILIYLSEFLFGK